MKAEEPDPIALLPLLVADLFELAGAFRRRGEAIARGLGQTQARWQVLSAASGPAVTVAQIARRLGVSRQNVQRIADLLVVEGVARFADNPDHRTSPYLLPTARGLATLEHLTRAAAASHAALAQRLAGMDLAALREGLRTVLREIEAGEPEPHP